MNKYSLFVWVKKVWLILKCLLDYHAVTYGKGYCYLVLCLRAAVLRLNALDILLKQSKYFIEYPFQFLLHHGTPSIVYWFKATIFIVKEKMSLLCWVPWLQWGQKECSEGLLLRNWNERCPSPDVIVFFCSPVFCSRQLSGWRATLPCWELPCSTAAPGLHCLCSHSQPSKHSCQLRARIKS